MAGAGVTTNVTSLAPSDQLDGLPWPLVARLARIADRLAGPDPFQVDAVTHDLADLAREITGAEVAYCRNVGHNEALELRTEPIWAPNVVSVGEIPKRKHREDCRCPFNRIDGGPRPRRLDDEAAQRKDSDGRPFYSQSELKHFAWLGSEAFIPLGITDDVPAAIIVLAHHDADHFSEARLELLRRIWGLFRALHQLGDTHEERANRVVLLQRVAQVLADFGAAPTLPVFHRAICTLLTCKSGFNFDRAFVFWMENNELPAECTMVVGGRSPDWAERRKAVGEYFKSGSLFEYIRYVFQYPVPGDGPCAVKDPLFEEICNSNSPLYFRADDGGQIREMIDSAGHTPGGVPKLSNADAWISKIRSDRVEIFESRHNEYFLFPLRPFGVDNGAPLLGFVIADLPYRAKPHTPGNDFPDLEMAAMVLRLIAGLWQHRQNSMSLVYMLAALPILRHGAPRLSQGFERLERAIRDGSAKEAVEARLVDLADCKDNICLASDMIDNMRGVQGIKMVEGVADDVRGLCGQFELRHSGRLECVLGPVEYDGGVFIPQEMLRSILTCLVDNAVRHNSQDRPLRVEIRVRKVSVPVVNGGSEYRIQIEVENDGTPIAVEERYIFLPGVTTGDAKGRGVGLSSARIQANAFGGDVVVLSRSPVCFGLLLKLRSGAQPVQAA